ncbi:hypothetical protein HC028_18990 [Planosporangium flavigriseum]|nr:hypothetical protein [Planosporangium flavigriseum]NJC66577.1 hypothetical protein [Planosporangium flavigriseum]
MSRVAALLAAPAAAACLLAGCGAGQEAQTSSMVPPVAGNEADSRPHGQAALRNVQIRYNNPQGYPAGATAPLSLYIANNSLSKPLVLRSVAAASAKSGTRLGPVVLLGGAPDIGAGVGEPSISAPSAAAPSANPSTSGAPARLTIPPNGYAQLDADHGGYLAVRNVTEALAPGSTARVTFTFEGEDPVVMAVPFGVPLSPPPPAPVVPSVTAPE